MHLHKTTFYGNSSIGLFARCNDSLCFIPIESSPKFFLPIEENLKAQCIKISIANSHLIGIYSAMNSNFMVLPYNIEQRELALIKEHIEPIVIQSRNNAWGNNLILTDKAGLISYAVSERDKKFLEDILGIELFYFSIGNYRTVGSMAICTSKGAIISFKANEEDIKRFQNLMKLKPVKCSVNMGSPFLTLGVLANSHGYVAGEKTTGVEIANIEEGLELIR